MDEHDTLAEASITGITAILIVLLPMLLLLSYGCSQSH
jgi:hypothetical protein